MKRILFGLVFLLLAMAVAGLSGKVNARAIAPEIVSFTATPRVIASGESSTLAWETRGTTTVAMEWDSLRHSRDTMQKRRGLPPSGTMIVQPAEDTVYVLECDTGSDQVCMSASATVRVK